MFKEQLSSSLIPEKVTIAVVPIIVYLSFSAIPLVITVLLFLLMVMLVPYSIYTIYTAHLNIAFDDKFTYITDRKTERIIPLSTITAIQPASNFSILRKRWQISCLENGAGEELFFYPIDQSAVEQFVKVVRAQNPMVSTAN